MHRVEFRRAPRRNHACRERHRCQRHDHSRERQRESPYSRRRGLFVAYQEFDGDLTSPEASEVSGDIEISAPVDVQISSTPEPGAWLLMASVLVMLGASRSARASRRGQPR